MESLYNSAKTTSDTDLGITATKLVLKNNAAALLTKLTTALTAADNALLPATDPSVAKTKAAADTAMTSIEAAAVTAKNAWVTLANTTTK